MRANRKVTYIIDVLYEHSARIILICPVAKLPIWNISVCGLRKINGGIFQRLSWYLHIME